MLRSSNLESIIATVDESANGATSTSLLSNDLVENPSAIDSNVTTTTLVGQQMTSSLASMQLAEGLLQIYEPSLLKARGQLKELIGKQNKIYIDLSAEKYKLDNAEIANLHEMMNNVKVYREKLIKIKKQMQNIYQRTKTLKKRAAHIQACKQKELQRKLQKQQQEESLIGKQQQQIT